MSDTDDRSYPRFSAGEMARRWGAVAAVLEDAEVDALVAYGADRSGATVQWLTQWPVTREALVLWRPGTMAAPVASPGAAPAGELPILLVQFANHVDNARRLAPGFDVRWGGSSTLDSLIELLTVRHVGSQRVGVVGALPASAVEPLQAAGNELVFLNGAVGRLRLVKSPEELEWVRRGAALTDLAVGALADGAEVGMAEAELGALVASAEYRAGGTSQIHYFAVTSMEAPTVRVPAQWPSDRRLRPGDVLACEVSANWWGYPGQLLRTFTVADEPTLRYGELHRVAQAAFDAVLDRVRPGTTGAELAEAASVIEAAGFAACDDVVHGFVGGYLPPIIPGAGRPALHGTFVLEANMTLVVQPNVVTAASGAGVQTGELVAVTSGGHERLHRFPGGISRIG